MLTVPTMSSAASMRVPADLFVAGRSADANKKLHNNMRSMKELGGVGCRRLLAHGAKDEKGGFRQADSTTCFGCMSPSVTHV